MTLQDELYKEHMGDWSMDLLVASRTDLNFPRRYLQDYGKCSRAYQITNEWHPGILKELDFTDKRVLAIVSSADFMIQALMRGASQVVGYDIALPSLFFAELKFAAMRNLDYNPFCEFFGFPRQPKRGAFSEEIFQELEGELSETARDFFERMIGKTVEYGPLRRQIPLVYAFTIPVHSKDAVRELTPHIAKEEEFEKAKAAIGEIPLMIPEDIRAVLRKPDVGEFDIVYSSNVIGDQFWELKRMLRLVFGVLKEGGKAVMTSNLMRVFEGLEKDEFDTERITPNDFSGIFNYLSLIHGYIVSK